VRLAVLNVSLPVPPPERAVYYAGLAVLAAVELIGWPVAVVIAAGDAVAAHSRNRPVRGVAESAESA
jgi:hypothetical protein